jgi:hypothetical protein
MTDTPMTPDREQEIRQQLADLLYSTYGQQDHHRTYAIADMVMPVVLAAVRTETDRLHARVAELEAQRSAVLALHRKHGDSEHCFADDEAWPCNTRTTLTTGQEADAATAEHHVVDGALHLCHTDDHYCPQDAAETEAAQLAAAYASCPGYEMSPNPCRCPCYGCKHHCSAHSPESEVTR